MLPIQQPYASRLVNAVPPKTHLRKSIKLIIVIFVSLISVKLVFFHSSAHVTAAVNKTIQKTAHQSICLDAGHGGEDPGAINGDLTEAATNLFVAKKAQSMLHAKGYTVYMTRTADVTLSNADRVNFCNDKKATILVSIHQNSFTDGDPDYSTALQYKPEDAELATTLAVAAGTELRLPVTSPVQFDDGMLIRATMPSVIVESLFISNTSEAVHKDRIDQQAQGIVTGIVSYLNLHKPIPLSQTTPTNK
ncbi:MAG: hypothetical protein NVSMB46_02040 [Candidatus Saccharimonadales bacterium]